MQPRTNVVPATPAERQRELARLILQDAENFNMATWFVNPNGSSRDLGYVTTVWQIEELAHKEPEHHCGTVACAAGMAAYHWADVIAAEYALDDPSWVTPYRVAEWLGVDMDLFHADRWPNKYREMVNTLADEYGYDEDITKPYRMAEAHTCAALLLELAKGVDPWIGDRDEEEEWEDPA